MDIEQRVPELIIGETHDRITLEDLGGFCCAIDRMAEQAKRHIKILTQEFDHDLYDRDTLASRLLKACRVYRGCHVSILLKDPNKAAKHGHRLVELQQRLPSCVEIRSLPREYEDMSDEYIIVDEMGMVKRFSIGYMRGSCEFRAIPDAVKYGRQFSDIWERSLPCQELRRLSL